MKFPQNISAATQKQNKPKGKLIQVNIALTPVEKFCQVRKGHRKKAEQ